MCDARLRYSRFKLALPAGLDTPSGPSVAGLTVAAMSCHSSGTLPLECCRLSCANRADALTRPVILAFVAKLMTFMISDRRSPLAPVSRMAWPLSMIREAPSRPFTRTVGGGACFCVFTKTPDWGSTRCSVMLMLLILSFNVPPSKNMSQSGC